MSEGNKTGSSTPSIGRRIGYIFAIIFMLVFLYLLRHAREWTDILNDNYEKCLFYIELSIYANILVNVIFIFYDNRWFRHLANAFTSVLGALSMIMIYVFFPLDLDETWVKWIKIGVLIIFAFTVLGTIIELVKGIRDLMRDPQKV